MKRAAWRYGKRRYCPVCRTAKPDNKFDRDQYGKLYRQCKRCQKQQKGERQAVGGVAVRNKAMKEFHQKLQQVGSSAPDLSAVTTDLFNKIGGVAGFTGQYAQFLQGLWTDEKVLPSVILKSFQGLTKMVEMENQNRVNIGDLSGMNEDDMFALLRSVAIDMLKADTELFESVADELGYALVEKDKVLETV